MPNLKRLSVTSTATTKLISPPLAAETLDAFIANKNIVWARVGIYDFTSLKFKDTLKVQEAWKGRNGKFRT
jgi:hypothetical protein